MYCICAEQRGGRLGGKLMTHRSESQDDMNKSTSDYVFWKINLGSGR